MNRKCTVDLAKKIDKIFFEIIIAPSFDVGSLKIFSKKKNLRVLSLKKYLSPEFFDKNNWWWKLRTRTRRFMPSRKTPYYSNKEEIDSKPTFYWPVCLEGG